MANANAIFKRVWPKFGDDINKVRDDLKDLTDQEWAVLVEAAATIMAGCVIAESITNQMNDEPLTVPPKS